MAEINIPSEAAKLAQDLRYNACVGMFSTPTATELIVAFSERLTAELRAALARVEAERDAAMKEVSQRDQLARLYRIEDALDNPHASETERVLELCQLLATTRRNQLVAEARCRQLEAEQDELLATNRRWQETADGMNAECEQARIRIRQLEAERDEARNIVAGVNNSVFGSQGYFISPNCVEQVEVVKLHHNQACHRAEAAEARCRQLEDALREFADKNNWGLAVGMFGNQVSGWLGQERPWSIADVALSSPLPATPQEPEHVCHDMNPPFPGPCRACEIERERDDADQEP